MQKVLVIGAAGLVGRGLVKGLLARGRAVRASVRDVDKARGLLPSSEQLELVRGDIVDRASMDAATKGVEAVYLCIHTLSPQPAANGQHFVATELDGIRNVIAACRANAVRRIFHVTFLGMTADSKTAWGKGRWEAEQLLLNSGLDATIFRPGQIVGKGGFGFETMMGNAKRSVAFVMGNGQSKHQNIALADLVRYLVDSLAEPRTYGHAFDVGSDETFTGDEMIDVAASVLGRQAPAKIHLPLGLLRLGAPLVERMAKMPKGAFGDLLAGMDTDLVGDTAPIRAIFPEPPLDYRSAIRQALE